MKIDENTIEQIEKVFDYRLAQWQRDFLLGVTGTRGSLLMPRGGRHNGLIFCVILHILLGDREEPVYVKDFDPPLFKHYIKPINDKLVEAGVKTNLVEE